MHELAVTQSIVEACSERAGDQRVVHVTVEVGTLSCVMPAAMRFCYDIATENTPLAGSALEIIRIPARAHCRDCGAEAILYNMLDACECGSINLDRPRGGDELRVKSMQLAPDAYMSGMPNGIEETV